MRFYVLLYFEKQCSEARAAYAQHVRLRPGHGLQRRDAQVGLVDGQPGKQHGRVRSADAQPKQQRDPGHHAHRTGLGADGVEP